MKRFIQEIICLFFLTCLFFKIAFCDVLGVLDKLYFGHFEHAFSIFINNFFSLRDTPFGSYRLRTIAEMILLFFVMFIFHFFIFKLMQFALKKVSKKILFLVYIIVLLLIYFNYYVGFVMFILSFEWHR